MICNQTEVVKKLGFLQAQGRTLLQKREYVLQDWQTNSKPKQKRKLDSEESKMTICC